MTADDLIVTLQAHGISLAANGDRLKVDAPVGALTAELRAALIEHKAILIAWLMDGDVAHSPQEAAQLGLFDPSPRRPARPAIDDGVIIRTADDWLNLLPDDEPICQPPDEVMPVIDSLIALLDRWEQADDPADRRWRQLWAQTEIAAGSPCFETRHHGARGEWFQIDAGPDGWWRWASGDSGKNGAQPQEVNNE